MLFKSVSITNKIAKSVSITIWPCFLSDKNDYSLIYIGNIVLYKKNSIHLSYCKQEEYDFEYYGIPNALCGRTRYYDEKYNRKGEYIMPMRIRVIQME